MLRPRRGLVGPVLAEQQVEKPYRSDHAFRSHLLFPRGNEYVRLSLRREAPMIVNTRAAHGIRPDGMKHKSSDRSDLEYPSADHDRQYVWVPPAAQILTLTRARMPGRNTHNYRHGFEPDLIRAQMRAAGDPVGGVSGRHGPGVVDHLAKPGSEGPPAGNGGHIWRHTGPDAAVWRPCDLHNIAADIIADPRPWYGDGVHGRAKGTDATGRVERVEPVVFGVRRPVPFDQYYGVFDGMRWEDRVYPRPRTRRLDLRWRLYSASGFR